VDSTLIQQVLVNLLENAIKYTPQQTEIEVRARVENHQVTFEVADHGPGVSEEMRAKIFEKFVRDDTSQPGFGLGLAICSGIVEAHGGEIKVENRSDGGAVFSFTLPIEGEMPEMDVLS
jgi:two-component system sensor histidine kinase KdpD